MGGLIMQVAAMLLAATSNMLSHLGEYACHQAVNHGFNRAMDQDMVELFGRLVVPVLSPSSDGGGAVNEQTFRCLPGPMPDEATIGRRHSSKRGGEGHLTHQSTPDVTPNTEGPDREEDDSFFKHRCKPDEQEANLCESDVSADGPPAIMQATTSHVPMEFLAGDIVVNTTTLFEERAFFPIATYSIPDYIAGDEAASCGNCNVNTVRVALKTYTGKVFEPGLRIGPASTTWVKHGWLLTLKPIPSPDVLGNLLGVKLYTEDFFVCAMSNSRENTKRRSDCLFLNARGRRH